MLVSNCCGAYPKSNGDNDSTDYGICPECGEHCEFIDEEETIEEANQTKTNDNLPQQTPFQTLKVGSLTSNH